MFEISGGAAPATRRRSYRSHLPWEADGECNRRRSTKEEDSPSDAALHVYEDIDIARRFRKRN